MELSKSAVIAKMAIKGESFKQAIGSMAGVRRHETGALARDSPGLPSKLFDQVKLIREPEIIIGNRIDCSERVPGAHNPEIGMDEIPTKLCAELAEDVATSYAKLWDNFVL